MIETLKEPDLKKAYSLMPQLGYEISEIAFIENVKLIQRQESIILVSKEGEEVVGLITVKMSVGLVEGIFGEIIALIVSERHRRKGIGRLLVGKAEEWVMKNANNILVRSNIIREGAHTFYKAIGYTHSKTQVLYKKFV
jgi:GNAT superfamily N-acetyltransferase